MIRGKVTPFFLIKNEALKKNKNFFKNSEGF